MAVKTIPLHSLTVSELKIDLGKTTKGRPVVFHLLIMVAANIRFPYLRTELTYGDKIKHSSNFSIHIDALKEIVAGKQNVFNFFISHLKETLNKETESPYFRGLKEGCDKIKILGNKLDLFEEEPVCFNQVFIEHVNRIFMKKEASVRRRMLFHKEPFRLVESFSFPLETNGPTLSFYMVTSGERQLPWVLCIIELDYLVNKEFDIYLTNEDFQLIINKTISAEELCIGKAILVAKGIFGEESSITGRLKTLYEAFFQVGVGSETLTSSGFYQATVKTYLDCENIQKAQFSQNSEMKK